MCYVLVISFADQSERNLPEIDPKSSSVARIGERVHLVCRAYTGSSLTHMAGPHSVYWHKYGVDGEVLEAGSIPGITVQETEAETE